MWLWIAAALGTFVTASTTGGLASVLLLFACVGCAAQAATRALPDSSDGLRDYRQ